MTTNHTSGMKSILAFVSLLLLAVCQSTPAQSAAPPARMAPLPDGVELTEGSSTLDVRIIENHVVDVHVRLNGQSTPRTLVIDPHPRLRQPSAVRRSERNNLYTLSTSGVSVGIDETAPYSITFTGENGQQLLRSADPFGEARNGGVTMVHATGDALYGISGIGLNETSVGLTRNGGGKVEAGVQGDSGAPFAFTVSFGLLVDSDGGDFSTAPGSVTFAHDSRPDVEYFLLAGPPLETMAALSRLVGEPPLPPEWTLGFLNSQWGSTQSEVERIVATYRSRQIPIDGFILDFDWKAWGEDDYGEWRWNSTDGPGNVAPDKFRDGASGVFARRLAAEGVKLAGILKPRILTTVFGEPNQPTDAASYATAHHFWYPNETLTLDYYSGRMARDLDFSIPAERAWYWQHLLPALHAGMAAWWDDEADYSGKNIFNNFQFLNMGRAIYDGQRADSNLRVWTINRNFYLGASRYGYAGWSGDIDTGFASLALQRRRMLAALDTGEFHWSMDAGGFHGHPSGENYARWIEFSAFVPIMRVHGELNEKRQPWVYGPTAEAAAHAAIDLRYELLPYIYSYNRLETEGGIGLVRPLFWEFPSDSASAAVDSEWMFGDALLVAPIVTQGITSKQIYLPPGAWFEFSTGQLCAGGQTVVIPTDATTWKDIPLFVRDGSILATQPLEQYVGQKPVREITLDIFPAQTGTAFTVYDDDGKTYNYERGKSFSQKITAQVKGNETRITIDGATGSYSTFLRTYLLRIHSRASGIAIDGRKLAKVDSRILTPEFRPQWTTANDRFGPLVLLRIPAGTRTLSTISVYRDGL